MNHRPVACDSDYGNADGAKKGRTENQLEG
jgi:hypothetical protein